MSRWIDADHLRKWILSWWERTEPTSEFLKGGDILNQIDREPSIDIVHCGECSKRKKNKFCLEHKRYEKDDYGYCSYGERYTERQVALRK